jgi:hypothetical protein
VTGERLATTPGALKWRRAGEAVDLKKPYWGLPLVWSPPEVAVPAADCALESGAAEAAGGSIAAPPADAAPSLDSPDAALAAALDSSVAADAAADSLEAELPDGEHPAIKRPLAAIAAAARRVLSMCGFL